MASNKAQTLSKINYKLSLKNKYKLRNWEMTIFKQKQKISRL